MVPSNNNHVAGFCARTLFHMHAVDMEKLKKRIKIVAAKAKSASKLHTLNYWVGIILTPRL